MRGAIFSVRNILPRSFSFDQERVVKENYKVFSRLINTVIISGKSRVNSAMSLTNEAIAPDDLTLARKIFQAGVDAAIPSKAIRNTVSFNHFVLKIQNENASAQVPSLQLDLKNFSKCHIVGFGKAVLPMAEELLVIMENNVENCILSVPHGTRPPNSTKIDMNTGAMNNIPDSDALSSAEKICRLVKSCTPQDLLIVLISGGGSALLPLPKDPITLEEKSAVIKKLSRAGASIFELNTFRKKISVLKGGGLVKICPAKQIVSLILSDVLNDPLDIIASGPTVKNPDDSSAALEILERYVPTNEIPPSILSVLKLESPKAENETDLFDKVSNIIIGNNEIALRAAANFASKNNLQACILTSTLEGEARQLGQKLAEFVLKILHYKRLTNEVLQNVTRNELHDLAHELHVSKEVVNQILAVGSDEDKSICILLGGETTVNVTGTGLGGRNQEFALASALVLDQNSDKTDRREPKITILCAGTDGIDGPCDAAGAVVDITTIPQAKDQNIEPMNYIANNDSFNFFKNVAQGKFHVITGHTGTNVMDLVVVIIRAS